MARASHGGRPWGPIRAESEEGAALALFLREQVIASGKTTTALAGETSYSKSTISTFLGGSRVPDEAFVTVIVRATVREPHLLKLRLSEAAALLHAAQHPSPKAALAPPPRSLAVELAATRAHEITTYERLTRALEQQNQLRETAENSMKLIMVLLAMIDRLEQRITSLTGESDRLRAAQIDPAVLDRTQQQLTRAQKQEQLAQQELARAQDKQRQAEDLAAKVQARVTELNDELRRLRADAPAGTATENDAARIPHETTAGTDPDGDDIDQTLTRVVEVNDRDGDLLQRITDELDPDDDNAVVVQDKHQNKASTSPDAADNISTSVPRSRSRFGKVLAEALLIARLSTPTRGDAGPTYALASPRTNPPNPLDRPHPDRLRRDPGPDRRPWDPIDTTRYFLDQTDLARTKGEQGDTTGAVAIYVTLLAYLERKLGPEHPWANTTRQSLTYWRNETDHKDSPPKKTD